MGQTDESDCISALQRAYQILDETPSRAQYDDLGISPSATTIRRVMGGWNVAKEKAGLETLTNGDRTVNEIQTKPDSVDLPEGVEWSELSAYQRYYYNNHQKELSRLRENNKKRREFLLEEYKEWRKSQECEICGEDHPACIQFHHTPEMEEERSLHDLVAGGCSLETMKEVASKGKIVCANCHKKEHWDEESGDFVY